MLDPSVFGDQDEEDQQVEKEEQHDPVEFGAGQQQGSELIATPNAVDVVRSTMTIPGAAATVSTSTGVAIDDSNGDGLPDDPEAIAAVYRDARDRGVVADDGTVVFTPEQVQSFLHLDDEAQATRIELLVKTFTDDALILGARDALDQAASRLSAAIGPAVPTVSVSGEVIASQDSLAAFTRAMVVSLPIAVAVTVLIVGLAIRSVRYSIVTILPILLVVFGVWGYMWARGFTINPVTATIAAIAVGVGIDFCTHFTVRFKEELAHTGERLEAVRRAGEGTGGALAISALTSIAGFGVMTAAPAPIFASFGELMAIMILLSAAVALLVLPCLLVVVTRPRADVATSTLLEPTGWSADPCETTSRPRPTMLLHGDDSATARQPHQYSARESSAAGRWAGPDLGFRRTYCPDDVRSALDSHRGARCWLLGDGIGGQQLVGPQEHRGRLVQLCTEQRRCLLAHSWESVAGAPRVARRYSRLVRRQLSDATKGSRTQLAPASTSVRSQAHAPCVELPLRRGSVPARSNSPPPPSGNQMTTWSVHDSNSRASAHAQARAPSTPASPL